MRISCCNRNYYSYCDSYCIAPYTPVVACIEPLFPLALAHSITHQIRYNIYHMYLIRISPQNLPWHYDMLLLIHHAFYWSCTPPFVGIPQSMVAVSFQSRYKRIRILHLWTY